MIMACEVNKDAFLQYAHLSCSFDLRSFVRSFVRSFLTLFVRSFVGFYFNHFVHSFACLLTRQHHDL